jgi:hypothetical protein
MVDVGPGGYEGMHGVEHDSRGRDVAAQAVTDDEVDRRVSVDEDLVARITGHVDAERSETAPNVCSNASAVCALSIATRSTEPTEPTTRAPPMNLGAERRPPRHEGRAQGSRG